MFNELQWIIVLAAVVQLTTSSQQSTNGKEEMFKYRSYKEINEYLEKVQKEHADIVSSFTIGYTVERRPINGIKISRRINDSEVGDATQRRAVLMDAGLHAREWIGPVLILYTIHQLINNETYANLTDSLDWYMLPMLNPDGYEFSMQPNGDRLWRKNRAPTPLANCVGVDLNRNFGYYWGGPGSSDDPCSQTYRGEHPFSEPESNSFANFLLSIKDRLKLYLTLHSAAQAIIYPWGYGDELPDDWMELENLAVKAVKAISNYNGTQYSVGPTTSIVGVGAGGSDDWAKGLAQIKYVYTFELPGPDYPEEGFHPLLEDLPRISIESFLGIKTFAEGIL